MDEAVTSVIVGNWGRLQFQCNNTYSSRVKPLYLWFLRLDFSDSGHFGPKKLHPALTRFLDMRTVSASLLTGKQSQTI